MNYSYVIFILIVVASFESSAMLKVMEMQKKTNLSQSQEQKSALEAKNIDDLVAEALSYADDEVRLRQFQSILHQKFKGDGCRQIRQELSKKLSANHKNIILYSCSCCFIKSQ